MRAFLDGLDGVDVAGDRVVHGGARFHATLLPAAATYAVGRDRNVRRYGFHGLSHAYAARRAAELSGDERRRIVTCLLWLLQRGDMHDTLEHRSGMRALAATADMEAVVARAEAHEPHALLAFEVYVHRLRAASGAMAASLSGLDALVFTAGVGENAPRRPRRRLRPAELPRRRPRRATQRARRRGRRDRRRPRRRADARRRRPRGSRDRRQARAVLAG